jgi:hypothetical protein
MASNAGPRRWFDEPTAETESPEALHGLRAQLDRVAEEKRRALADPGPSWRVWWFHHAAKWYVVLGLLIADLWLVTLGVETGGLAFALVALAGLLYLEFLLYRFLWYRPRDEGRRAVGAFRPTLVRPVRYGRWTPEADYVRSGGQLDADDDGAKLREFA